MNYQILKWIGIVLILCGCASNARLNWAKSGAGRAELEETVNDCANMAGDLGGYKDQQTDFGSCMRANGWSLQ